MDIKEHDIKVINDPEWRDYETILRSICAVLSEVVKKLEKENG